ncbi:MAG TPA: type I pullulanase [Spirochaetota bacterium]|nr:type I pullulanase [Spirochaetota bacterium]
MHNKDKLSLLNAIMEDYNTISVYFNTQIDIRTAKQITFFRDKKVSDYSLISVHDTRAVISVDRMDIKKLYVVGFHKEKKEVIPFHVLDREEFIYRGDDLGVTYSKERSIFKVFAPTATKVRLNIYDSLETNEKKSFQLTESNNGIWEIVIEGDLKGKYYSYNVDGELSLFDYKRDLVDPYARCVIGNKRRALIIDLNDYPEANRCSRDIPIKDFIIYEIHIRDISIDRSSSIINRGKYSGLTEFETYLNSDRSSGIKTGLAHIKELGVNTIQIMPLQDFDNNEENENEYNWGYMPKNFNTPDRCYSSNWKTDAKIIELKELINFLHKEGLRVNLDVVYNHTAEGFWGDEIYSFNGFVPYYYYRIGNGYISNGSGCGNEMRTEAPMVRKFIIDSIKFLTKFYGFDGYRFDLMGLIDLTTIEDIIKNLKEIKPDIFIYGEPWTGGLTPIHPTYKGSQRNKHFSVFNDDYRDAIKGPVFNRTERGYIQTKGQYHYDRIIQGILGSINTFTAHPVESLNYVEVHDNNTLFDKLYFTETENLHATKEDFEMIDRDLLERIKKLHKLAAFLILTSQGIPVLHLGMDFLRTKFGVENSYNSGDIVNKIDWNRKKEFYDVFIYYKNLIEIRNNHPLFKIENEHILRNSIEFKREIFHCECSHCIAYILKNHYFKNEVNSIFVIINPYDTEVKINLEPHKWKKLLIEDTYYRDKIEVIESHEFIIPKLSGNILYE